MITSHRFANYPVTVVLLKYILKVCSCNLAILQHVLNVNSTVILWIEYSL